MMLFSLQNTNGIELHDVEEELQRDFKKLRFSPNLERAFDSHERLTKNRYLIVSGLIGCVLYVAFLISDWQLVPDVFVQACLLRLAVFLPLMLATLTLIALVHDTRARETTRALMAIIATSIVMGLVFVSKSPYRCPYHYGVLLIMVHVVVSRLRFRYALVTMIGILVIVAVASCFSDAFDRHLQIADAMLFFSGATFLLTAVFGIERESRKSFLLALKSSLLHSALENYATLDPLTGLGNRRRLDAGMIEAWRSFSDDIEMSIIIIDVDHFKSFNDTVGHLEGDACLKRIAATITDAFGQHRGEAIRFGGEEFVMFLPNTTPVASLALADELVRLIRIERIPHPGCGIEHVVTISVGVSSGKRHLCSPEELLRTADSALYVAKAAGRNCVRFKSTEQRSDGNFGPDEERTDQFRDSLIIGKQLVAA